MQQETAPATHVAQPHVQHNSPAAQAGSVAQDDQIFFYNGEDVTSLQNTQLQRVRELQNTNDAIQRQINQMDKDIKSSSDALSILAERERCLIMIARNTGEILKIHAENEDRLRRIAALEAENNRLRVEAVTQRDKFIDTHEMRQRTKHASNFFLAKSKIEKNTSELLELTQD